MSWGWVRVGSCLKKVGLGLIAVAWYSQALGGPSQPPSLQNHFEEISPLIQDIEIKKGDPFIEVFIVGAGNLDCYDVREFAVEKMPNSTHIIPRLRRLNPLKPCKIGLKTFRDKAADLDPANPSSYQIEVLSYKGWQKRSLPR